MLLIIQSTVILFMSQNHDNELGPKSDYGRSLENDTAPDAEPKPL